MAIQVSGTEVISNSRVLSNVTGLKTVGGTAILGSGDIAVGGSTAYGAVGTYIWAAHGPSWSDVGAGTNMAGTSANGTYAGSTLYPIAMGSSSLLGPTTSLPYSRFQYSSNTELRFGNPSESTVSGTWRLMGNFPASAATTYSAIALYVRTV